MDTGRWNPGTEPEALLQEVANQGRAHVGICSPTLGRPLGGRCACSSSLILDGDLIMMRGEKQTTLDDLSPLNKLKDRIVCREKF